MTIPEEELLALSNSELIKKYGVSERTIRRYRNKVKERIPERSFIIPDLHIPYHCNKYLSLVFKVLKELNPQEVVLLGDVGDFYSVNSHGNTKGELRNLNKEIGQVQGFLKKLREIIPDAKLVYIEGNHEDRLQRYILKEASMFDGIVSFEGLLKLKECGVDEFVSYEPEQSYDILGAGQIFARHTPLSVSQNSARLSLTKSFCSLLYGHIHRIEEAHCTSLNGEDMVAQSVGWGGDSKHPIFGYVKGHHQWQQGFGVVTKFGDTLFTNIYQVKETANGEKAIIFNNKLFTS